MIKMRMCRVSGHMLALFAAAALAVPAWASRSHEGEAKLQAALSGRVPGKPVKCIPLRQIQSSYVIEGTAIVYEAGSKIYVNRPENGAESLSSNDILVSRTHSNALCDIDTIDLVDRSSRLPSGTVFLGEFIPYARVAN